jgi:hypothetical protein
MRPSRRDGSMISPSDESASPKEAEMTTSRQALNPDNAPSHAGWVVSAMEGVVALARNEIFVATPRYLFAFDLTTWGWIQIILGVVVLAAGVGVITGQLWGRLVGITIAGLSMLANFAFIPYYPVWSLLIIALNVFVIWALCVYNRDTAASL